MAQTRIEYRIIGRFAKDEKSHVVDWDRTWTKEQAEHRLKELIDEQERDKQRGHHTDYVGMIGVDTPYLAEYALCDLKIQAREVTPWMDVVEE